MIRFPCQCVENSKSRKSGRIRRNVQRQSRVTVTGELPFTLFFEHCSRFATGRFAIGHSRGRRTESGDDRLQHSDHHTRFLHSQRPAERVRSDQGTGSAGLFQVSTQAHYYGFSIRSFTRTDVTVTVLSRFFLPVSKWTRRCA